MIVYECYLFHTRTRCNWYDCERGVLEAEELVHFLGVEQDQAVLFEADVVHLWGGLFGMDSIFIYMF